MTTCLHWQHGYHWASRIQLLEGAVIGNSPCKPSCFRRRCKLIIIVTISSYFQPWITNYSDDLMVEILWLFHLRNLAKSFPKMTHHSWQICWNNMTIFGSSAVELFFRACHRPRMYLLQLSSSEPSAQSMSRSQRHANDKQLLPSRHANSPVLHVLCAAKEM